jgi:hypothetical protein
MMKSSILRRKSIELLKELTQILQEIIGSGDEESFRRLEETIRKLDESRRRPSVVSQKSPDNGGGLLSASRGVGL